ncbi:D-alanyl-D-alanine carboxypeptidase/D-alanyl-D-alanine-endopeptidase [Shewanella sp. AS1]|uniref:D-alanyl-D-alanine carboxypeptidase/D-alanyl-D-alanine endopeptidase n=1 Tax=Shewanella sp. AS1 TaxID=2907626 RepID=UPI001F1ABDDC|nr:D-alanyl-D-alanine carboxypeptidase/D-alanyl-D-alanine-endopeptidase [Shewanella sp. AS1]MCE9678409.1 D-alanyl-D-alanine carboxypeptidase/D-alanyl-D-alanine-endopeptidase [Shewanella sp. AS1]
MSKAAFIFKLSLGLSLGLSLLFGIQNFAQGASSQYLDNLMSVIKPTHSQVGVTVTDLSANAQVFTYNADTLFIPASTQKLLTAVAATAHLPASFRYQTALYSNGVIDGDTFLGDLYLQFSGDPTLSSDNIRELFKQLADKGVHRVNGNLYLVGELNEQQQAPGWVWDDLGICYAAPVSSFVIDQNCLQGELKPRGGGSVLSFPSYLPVSLTTQAHFDARAQDPFCQLQLRRGPDNQFTITGCYSGTNPVPLSIALSDPALYAKAWVPQLALSGKIQINGKVQIIEESQINVNSQIVALHESVSLPKLLTKMLEDSNNLIADSLFKAIGGSVYHTRGDFINGAQAMIKLLKEEGVDLSHAQIVDGSGLSRYNLLSANQLAQVLALIARDSRFSGLRDMLPIAGETGTLRNKSHYHSGVLKERVIAKTGSMQGVDNLAGFLTIDTRRSLLFVILENGQSPKAKASQLAPFSALFLQSVLDQAGSEPTLAIGAQ